MIGEDLKDGDDMILEEDSVEPPIDVKEKIKSDINENNCIIFESEGISKNEEGKFSIFQRFILKNGVENIKTNFMAMSIKKKLGKKIDVFDFLKRKGFNVFFIVFTSNCSYFWIFTVENKNITLLDIFNSCDELSSWLSEYVPKRDKIKPFRKILYLRCIDKCLRDMGVPYPGNFDGIIFCFNGSLRPTLLLEFSKVKYTSLEEHKRNLKGKLGDKFFREDRNRWSILFEVSKILNISNRIIWWSTKREEYMIGTIRHVTSKEGIQVLSGTIDYNSLIEEIRKLIKGVHINEKHI